MYVYIYRERDMYIYLVYICIYMSLTKESGSILKYNEIKQ